MIENEVNVSQSSDTGMASSAPEVAPATTPSEKMLPQSQVDSIVKHEKYSAYEKGKREAAEEYQRSQASQASNNQAASYQSSDAINAEQAKAIMMAELQRESQQRDADARQQYVNQFVSQFGAKLESGKAKYDDFEATLQSVDLANAGNVVILADQVDNTADVMYELAKNRPQDLVNLEMLAEKHPAKAREQMQKLSESIKVNQKAAQVQRPNEPLRQISSSNAGMDNGSEHGMSVADFRNIRY